MNPKQLMKQVQQMQEQMQQRMAELRVEGSAGGGMVKATMNGNKEVLSVSIDKEAVDPNDVEMLQDLVVAAVNEAARKVDEEMQGQIGAMTGGMVATAIVFFPAAPFFLFMHGKDISIPKGHEVTVYTNTDHALIKTKGPAAVEVPLAKPASGLPLTNGDVLKLKAAGLSEQLIIEKIKASPANYQLDTNDLVELKQSGNLSEAIIAAMIQASQR